MIVIRGLSTNRAQPLTSPFPAGQGIFIELRGGDILHPRGQGDWFRPPYFARIFRAFCRWPVLPFVSWRLGTWGGYLGAKAYGADSDAYRAWMPAGDVGDGSVALMLSIRPFATLKP